MAVRRNIATALFTAGAVFSNAFSPREIANLACWLRADLGVTLVSSHVSTWADQSGSGRDATQGTAGNRPGFAASGINSLPSVTFAAATAQWLSLPDLSALTAAECHMAIRRNGDPPPDTPHAGLWKFGTDASGDVVPWTDGNVYDSFGSTVRKTAGSSAGKFASATIYSAASKANAWTDWLNGTQQFTTGTNTFAMSATPLFGKSADGSLLDGSVSEFAMWSRVLSATEHRRVVRYMGSRYGVAVSA